jgi:cytochrome c-type biogenesis protein CcmF
VAAIAVAIAVLIVGARAPYAILAFAFAAFAFVANVREYLIGVAARQRSHGEGFLVALGRLVSGNRRRYGGYLAHLGVVSVAVAIAASSTFRSEGEATLKKGGTMTVRGLTLRLDDVWGREEPQRQVVGATLTVLRGARVIARLDPRMNFYPTSQQPVPTPAVDSRLSGDIYVNLMAFQPDGSSATVRVILEPLVPWIWAGGLIVCLGSIVAVWPTGRKRTAAVTSPAATGLSSPGALEGAAS